MTANEPANSAAHVETQQPLATVDAFSVRRLTWQITRDRLLRWGVTLGVVAVLFAVAWPSGASALAVALAVVLAVGAWMLLNGISARTSVDLPRLTAMIEAEPERGEDYLAWHLKRKPLMKWVRLLLYHRLALLRHHQRSYDEAAAICGTVLGYRLGPAEPTRRQLWLLLAEAQLERGDAAGAFAPIQALYHAKLSLIESMQRLALQTRYELLAGFPERALWRHPQKQRLAELMPAGHGGAVQAMLATAADRCEQRTLGRRLWQRVRLLSTDAEREQFEQGRFNVNLVHASEDATDGG